MVAPSDDARDERLRSLLAHWGPFWGHPTPVTSRQGFTHCDYGWLPVTLEDEGGCASPWMPPRLELLVHVFDQCIDTLRRSGGFQSEVTHFSCDHSKAPAMLTCSSGFNGGIG